MKPETAAGCAAYCAVLGLLSYRAGYDAGMRPTWFTHPWQLEAFQIGWTTGYDSEHRVKTKEQAVTVCRLISYEHHVSEGVV